MASISAYSLAIMQPYVFPYLGYFQLINAVDKYIMFDDVAFIKGGWINRNAILSKGKRQRFTIPVLGASPNKKIREVLVSGDPHWKRKLLATIEQAYSKAPFFSAVFPLIEGVFRDSEQKSLADLASRSILAVSDTLKIMKNIKRSSGVYENQSLGRTERLIDICRQEGMTTLINPGGGRDLYCKDRFREDGIDLRFLQMRPVTYQQFRADSFVPSLSIIDVLMFNGRDGTRTLLEDYDLL